MHVTAIEIAVGFSQDMERAAQGGGRGTIPTGVKKKCVDVALSDRGMVEMGWQLDLMILVVHFQP